MEWINLKMIWGIEVDEVFKWVNVRTTWKWKQMK